jgi:transposase InsO family protein
MGMSAIPPEAGLEQDHPDRERRSGMGPLFRTTWLGRDNAFWRSYMARRKRFNTAPRSNGRHQEERTRPGTRQGWLYPAVVTNLNSRRIVGWAMDRRVGRHQAIEALTMASGYHNSQGRLLACSDRGQQYTSDDLRDVPESHAIECSMSARRHCYDSAPPESFFSLLKRARARGQN